jgi:putative nucleotidyltransferase with HDIG domain
MDFLMEKLKDYDPFTYLHSQRIADLSSQIAKQLNLTPSEQKDVYYGALLHDIGKIKIDRLILNKPERLTLDEWKIVQQHPILGYEIINPFCSGTSIPYIVLMHHERCDGSGYPFGLKGSDIPLGPQIIAVADSYDAMITARPYKKAKTREQVIMELEGEKNNLYLADVVDAFLQVQMVNKYFYDWLKSP